MSQLKPKIIHKDGGWLNVYEAASIEPKKQIKIHINYCKTEVIFTDSKDEPENDLVGTQAYNQGRDVMNDNGDEGCWAKSADNSGFTLSVREAV